MKINFCTALKNFEDKILKDPQDNILTLKSVAISALMISEDNESGERKFQKYMLASQIHKSVEAAEELDMTPEDISMLKTLIAKGYGPMVVGASYPLLNG